MKFQLEILGNLVNDETIMFTFNLHCGNQTKNFLENIFLISLRHQKQNATKPFISFDITSKSVKKGISRKHGQFPRTILQDTEQQISLKVI